MLNFLVHTFIYAYYVFPSLMQFCGPSGSQQNNVKIFMLFTIFIMDHFLCYIFNPLFPWMYALSKLVFIIVCDYFDLFVPIYRYVNNALIVPYRPRIDQVIQSMYYYMDWNRIYGLVYSSSTKVKKTATTKSSYVPVAPGCLSTTSATLVAPFDPEMKITIPGSRMNFLNLVTEPTGTTLAATVTKSFDSAIQYKLCSATETLSNEPVANIVPNDTVTPQVVNEGFPNYTISPQCVFNTTNSGFMWVCGEKYKTEPITSAPMVTEPVATLPVITDPVITQPVVTEPVTTLPVVTEPVVTEPIVTDPVVTDPVVTDPVVTDPIVTDPVVTEPVVTNPVAIAIPGSRMNFVTDPVVTEPIVTEPVVTKPVHVDELQINISSDASFVRLQNAQHNSVGENLVRAIATNIQDDLLMQTENLKNVPNSRRRKY